MLVARVIYVKDGVTQRFVILDAAMNDLIRPALYDAWHEIVPVARAGGRAPRWQPADVVGPVCETGDSFAAEPPAAAARRGRPGRAAVGRSLWRVDEFGLQYPPAGRRRCWCAGDQFAVIRPRPSYEQVLAQDRMPPWLAER